MAEGQPSFCAKVPELFAIILGCRPNGQLLQSFGQCFELFVCAEFVESVNADLNGSGVIIGYIVNVFGFAHDSSLQACRFSSGFGCALAVRMSLLARC